MKLKEFGQELGYSWTTITQQQCDKLRSSKSNDVFELFKLYSKLNISGDVWTGGINGTLKLYLDDSTSPVLSVRVDEKDLIHENIEWQGDYLLVRLEGASGFRSQYSLVRPFNIVNLETGGRRINFSNNYYIDIIFTEYTDTDEDKEFMDDVDGFGDYYYLIQKKASGDIAYYIDNTEDDYVLFVEQEPGHLET